MRNSMSDQIYYSTVRITCEDGTGGTAFFVGTNNLYPEFGKIFLVSNNHVVRKMQKFSITFHIGDRPIPEDKTGTYEHKFKQLKWQNIWKSHTDPEVDIAVMDFTPFLYELAQMGKYIYFKALPLDQIPVTEKINSIKSIEEITFVGYPAGLIDEVNNLPIARKGHLATPLHENFNGKPLFLVDASVFGGSSGSPVCILNDGGSYSYSNGNTIFNSRFYLIGTLFETTFQRHDGQNIDLGRVWKSQTILETIEHHFLPGIIEIHKNC